MHENELDVSSEAAELCPHGKLPGICEECLKTDEGREKQAEIEDEAKGIGSEIARNLEAETGIQPYDVTMVLGAGFREPITNTQKKAPENQSGYLLNFESRMRLNAAAKLYFQGRTRLICVTGGKALSEKWKNYPSLAELGKKYLIEKYSIPEKDIISEDQSDATHGNLAYGLREMYKENIPVGKFAIVSSDYHLRRAKEMAERSGIKADLVPAERELLDASPHYRKYIENWLAKDKQQPLEDNETAKLNDESYWRERSAVFTTPLDEAVPAVDVTKTIAETARRLTEAGVENVQTDAF